MSEAGEIAVLDVGKTNVVLCVASAHGTLLEARSTPNAVLPGPPWRHHDLGALSLWVCETLADLARSHPIRTVVPVGHGSGGALVGADPDAPGGGAALPMIDYEQPCPPEIDTEYAAKAGTFEDRGSPIMMASTHAARQMLWMARSDPSAFAKARHYLNTAQYWGWVLTGVAASEHSAMGAQTHLRNVPRGRWSPIVESEGWEHLLPRFRAAWEALGPIRPDLVRRFGLPDGIIVLTGAHDSSSNFYRYLAGGLQDFTLVSTGTWVVGLTGEADITSLDRTRGTTINADMEGNPVGGALVMGGREFSAVAGTTEAGHADLAVLEKLVAHGTMALPAFGDNEGQFPGSARKGRIVGPLPESQAERTALAVLYTALLTATCAEVLKGGNRLILDGTFLRDPLYAPLVAALRHPRPTQTSDEPRGVIAGAVLLAGHATRKEPARLKLNTVTPVAIPGLTDYARRWRDAAAKQGDCTT